jgi:isopentenyl-diphosphate delta-isomerase
VLRNDRVVSFDSEQLILVDAEDRELGYMRKSDAHEGSGTLHRAFSIFVFNSRGELLLQQRAAGKRLWPGYWSNTCCSHPRKGETMDIAVNRRLHEELGIHAPLRYLYKFEYQAQFDASGAEHELCWVYAGRSDEQPRVNPNEISAVRFVAADVLNREITAAPEQFSPWFKMEWQRIQREHLGDLARLQP